jgi:hypothetical protein
MNTHTITAAWHGLATRRGTKFLACAAGAAAIAATALGSPASAVSGVTGTGTTTCNAGWNGSLSFSPPLVNGGTATTVGVTMKATFKGCTGGSPTPKAGSYVAKGVVSEPGADNCANWFAAPLVTPPQIPFNQAPLDGAVTWAPSTINPSNASFTTMRIWTGSSHRLIIHLPAPTASVVTGSYAPTAHLVLRTGVPVTTATGACAAGGVTGLPIVPASPSSVLSTGSW